MFRKTEGTFKNVQSRETGREQKTQDEDKHNTICVDTNIRK
jgi:hypothetical protein